MADGMIAPGLVAVAVADWTPSDNGAGTGKRVAAQMYELSVGLEEVDKVHADHVGFENRK